MDLGDAWEHADDASYPEPMTGLAYRIAAKYRLRPDTLVKPRP